MPHRTPRKMTLVELMVVVAMVGILAAILVPAMHQGKRRARNSRHGAVTTAPNRPTEGQYNTIAPSQTAKRVSREPRPASKPAFGWVVQVAIAAAIIRAISALRRQGNRQLVRKSRHKHPPHDAS